MAQVKDLIVNGSARIVNNIVANNITGTVTLSASGSVATNETKAVSGGVVKTYVDNAIEAAVYGAMDASY